MAITATEVTVLVCVIEVGASTINIGRSSVHVVFTQCGGKRMCMREGHFCCDYKVITPRLTLEI